MSRALSRYTSLASGTYSNNMRFCVLLSVLEFILFVQTKRLNERPWLLLANQIDLRLIDLSGYMKIVAEDLQSSVSTDYDYKDDLIFWSDVGLERILSIDGLGNITTVVDKKIKTPDGIAVDWVYNHLYWTDTGYDTIEVASYDGAMRVTLVSENLDEPRAIVVDPKNGFMYWTDWGINPKIERCGMDGQRRELIVNRDIVWPNGLTIDYVAQKLYWSDAKRHHIKSANVDGTNIETVLHDINTIVHPFSITVFEDTLYWSEWSQDSVNSIDKRTGLNFSRIVIGLNKVMGLKIFDEHAQINHENYCPTSPDQKCSYLCLPAPLPSRKRYSCVCPTGINCEGKDVTPFL